MCSSVMSFLRGSGSSVSTVNRSLPLLRQAGHAQNVPVALGVHVVARLHIARAPAASRDCWACPRCSTANCLPRPAATAQTSATQGCAPRASRPAARRRRETTPRGADCCPRRCTQSADSASRSPGQDRRPRPKPPATLPRPKDLPYPAPSASGACPSFGSGIESVQS